jgi:hypothetical protein
MGNKPGGQGGMGRFGQAMGQFGGQLNQGQPGPGQIGQPNYNQGVPSNMRGPNPWATGENMVMGPGGLSDQIKARRDAAGLQPGQSEYGPTPGAMDFSQPKQQFAGRMGRGLFGNRGGGGY